MRRNVKHIAAYLLVLMGYYLLPEHYLLAFHPHEHDPHCCSLHASYEGQIISAVPQHCLEKENYKLIYDFQPKFFEGFRTQKEIFCLIYNAEKIKAVSLFLSKPRAPPGSEDRLIYNVRINVI